MTLPSDRFYKALERAYKATRAPYHKHSKRRLESAGKAVDEIIAALRRTEAIRREEAQK